jgi:hypothetical protein
MSVKQGTDVKQKQIMALRQCTECGQMISDKAPNCPKCGAPVVAPAPTQIPEQQTPPYNNSAQGQTIIIHQQSQTNGIGMEANKVNMWIGMNAENFNPTDLMVIKGNLEKMDDDKFTLIQSIEFRKPSTILIVAILLGWERFWLDDIALGVVKIITGYGCGLWWLIDIFSAKGRAQKYNFKKFLQFVSLCSI